MGTNGVELLKKTYKDGDDFIERNTIDVGYKVVGHILDIKYILDRSNITTRDITNAFDYRHAIAYIAQYLRDYAIYLKRKPDDKLLYTVSATLYAKGGSLYLLEWPLFFQKIKLLMYDGPVIAGKDTYSHDNVEGKQMLRYLMLYMNERMAIVERMHATIDASYKQQTVPMPESVKKLIHSLVQKSEECRKS